MHGRSKLPLLSDRLPLGTTGLAVSPVCLGLVGDPRIVLEAFDRGVNFFFLTADMHWPVYEATRRGLRELLRARPAARDSLVVGVVSYVTEPCFTLAPFLEVLDELPELERIDLAIAGNARQQETERLRTLQSHGTTGRVPGVRATGGTFHDLGSAAALANDGSLHIAFMRYSSAHRSAERLLFPHVGSRRSLLFNFKSTSGYVPRACLDSMSSSALAWKPSVADHYRYVLGRSELDGVLCALSSCDELRLLAHALEAGPLADDQRALLTRASDLFRIRSRETHPTMNSETERSAQ